MSEHRSRGRSVPALYGAVSLVLVAGALTFALSTPPPSTPPLAEVAPAPQEQVEVERVEQSSRFGEGGQGGEGECQAGEVGCEGTSEQDAGPGAATPTPGPGTDGSLSSGDTWKCVNGPGGPRQTEDPQSPPCVLEKFTGDNGGATSRGVTATEIRIAVPIWGKVQDDELAFAAYFNDRYEFYGRRIVLDFVEAGSYESTPAGKRAYAKDVASRDVFASLDQGFGASESFHTGLAEAGVISVFRPQFNLVTESTLARHHPYLWSAWPTAEEAGAATGALACRSLVGRPASLAGDDVRDRTRVFGVIAETARGNRFAPEALLASLDACGAPYHTYERDTGDEAGPSLDVLVQRMIADGVTTVSCLCHNGSLEAWSNAAEAAGYRPEWFHPGIDDADIDKKSPREQRARMFGLTPAHRRFTWVGGNTARVDEHYWYTAMREADPDIEPETSWGYHTYAQLLVIASGIQAAGPDLTPETFGGGLTALTFPNPLVGQSPWWQPSVGFGPRDHSFNSDFALIWWRNDPAEVERSQFGPKGELCYVGDGLRYTAANMPADAEARFFDPEAGCR